MMKPLYYNVHWIYTKYACNIHQMKTPCTFNMQYIECTFTLQSITSITPKKYIQYTCVSQPIFTQYKFNTHLHDTKYAPTMHAIHTI